MCGVLATVGADRATFDRAFALIEHRGVRHRVYDCPKGVLVGHARLPIVGLDDAYDQPFHVENWTAGYVGEILDFRDHEPDAECDLGLVARTWAAHGPAGFRRFDGFWSVVAVDQMTGDIHALVDYLAQKPLYCRSDRAVAAAASEPDAVAALAPVTPDEIYFAAVVKWGYCPETWRTPYREVWRALPGQHVVLRRGQPTERHSVDGLSPRAATPEMLKAEVELAVRRRVLSSDVPVACLVSGGLDSAIVYTVAKRYGDVVPYHVENGEAEWAQKVVGERGAHYCDPTAMYALEAEATGCDEGPVERALRYFGEPVDLGSLIPQVTLSDAIGNRGGERVCLSGDGADELFGGYARAERYDSQKSDVFHELVGWHLPRLDRVMMRNRVEVRSPFLSRRVAEMALALARPERTGKKVLRDLFRGDLPEGVADRPKRALRTATIEVNREANSKMLVDKFRAARWPAGEP